MTTEIARFMHRLEAVWDDHLDALLERRDVDAALAGMTREPSVRHLPTATGADGREAVERYYREALIGHLPGELTLTRRSRTVDRFRLVDELSAAFVHDCELAWLTPGVAPTGRRAEVSAVAIVEFRRDAIASLRMRWDVASLSAQLGVTVALGS